MPNLLSKIRNKSAKIAVVGVGYVGLPVAALFAKAGFYVAAVDINQERIAKLNRGQNPIEGKEPGLDALLKSARRTKRLRFTTDFSAYSQSDIIIIAVETPVERNHKPKYITLKSALKSIAHFKQVPSEKRQGKNAGKAPIANNRLQPADELMLIVESTVAPLTVNNLIRPMVEKLTSRREGKDLYVVNCPERLMPGALIKKITGHSRVVGVANSRAFDMARLLYRNIIKHQPRHREYEWRGELDRATNLEAEIVKTAENAYRDVQIAFANELAWICERFGADFWRVRELIRKSPGRDVHKAGAGVGGHCIPKDSWLLLSPLKNAHRDSVIAHSRSINDDAPHHLFKIIAKALRDNKVVKNRATLAIMGYSYLEDSDDTRNSPTLGLIKLLDRAGFQYQIHDPFVPQFSRRTAMQILKDAQVAVFMVAHSLYRGLSPRTIAGWLKPPQIVVDGRHIFNRVAMEKEGIKYYGVGDIKN